MNKDPLALSSFPSQAIISFLFEVFQGSFKIYLTMTEIFVNGQGEERGYNRSTVQLYTISICWVNESPTSDRRRVFIVVTWKQLLCSARADAQFAAAIYTATTSLTCSPHVSLASNGAFDLAGQTKARNARPKKISLEERSVS